MSPAARRRPTVQPDRAVNLPGYGPAPDGRPQLRGPVTVTTQLGERDGTALGTGPDGRVWVRLPYTSCWYPAERVRARPAPPEGTR